jgi:hypothetical protein
MSHISHQPWQIKFGDKKNALDQLSDTLGPI